MKRKRYLPFWLAPIILIAIFLTSCGTLKRSLNKTKEKESVVSTESTKTVETVTNSLTTISNRTITESIDTNIVTKEKSIETEFSLNNLFDGCTIEDETEDLKIQIKYDSVTKKVKAVATKKKQVIPVHVQKKTVENINQDFKSNSDKTIDQNKDFQSKTLSKDKEVNSEASSGINWTLVIITLFIILIIAYLIYRKFFL